MARYNAKSHKIDTFFLYQWFKTYAFWPEHIKNKFLSVGIFKQDLIQVCEKSIPLGYWEMLTTHIHL